MAPLFAMTNLLFVSLLLASFTALLSQAASSTSQTECTLDYDQIPFQTLTKPLTESYGNYLRSLGFGPSGRVSLFRRFEDGQVVAIKHFRTNFRRQNDVHAQEYEQQIKLEYHIGALLSGLDGIAQTLDLLYEVHSSTWHLVTEYCPHNLVAERHQLSTADTHRIFKQTLSATLSIHRQGIAYGDAKIENVLLTYGGGVKLIDFGSATFAKCGVESSRNDVNVVPGDFSTAAYMPPEVFNILEYDRQKADVWALGILFHLLLLGHPPWKLASLADENFRYFMGWETKRSGEDCSPCQRCLLPYSKLEYGTCPLERNELFSRLPESARGLTRDLLEPDPMRRPALDTVLAGWRGGVLYSTT